MKVEPLLYGDRKVYTVAGFNRGVAEWLARLPTLWIEGEVTELRRHERWASVFFTLKDPADGACVPASLPRRTFDALGLQLERRGARARLSAGPSSTPRRESSGCASSRSSGSASAPISPRIERLKAALAADGLFDEARKRALPRFPRRIGLVTGNDAAAKRDVLTTITARFPPARILVAETLVQGPRAAAGIVEALKAVAGEPEIDVVVLARGGGSFDDLLPFSDERVVRAVAACPVPIVSAVGHEQDTPLCDLAADVRASTPTAAGKLVVPDLLELRRDLARSRTSLERCVRRAFARDREVLERAHDSLERGARRALERDARKLALLRDRLRREPALLRRAPASGNRAHGREARGAVPPRDPGAGVRDRASPGRDPALLGRGRSR